MIAAIIRFLNWIIIIFLTLCRLQIADSSRPDGITNISILAVGDSLTYGFVLESFDPFIIIEHPYTLRLKQLLSTMNIFNIGVSGAIFFLIIKF